MEDSIRFNDLLLKSAFACMACDGNIDDREVNVVKKIAEKEGLSEDENIEDILNNYIDEINRLGSIFFRNFFNEVDTAVTTVEEDMKVVEVMIDTIIADEEVEYDEIKFFKVVRSKLKISDDLILEKHPDWEEYLEKDVISSTYLTSLQGNYFDEQELPKFAQLDDVNDIEE